ncbi:sensor histidine kinase [Paenibacillus piri]|uniref:Sensor histidine kinase n=1 Tax=Paenibacillus piri TaxID=2547395 RepID=A0A4R5KMD3_9BACL|nr:histidine kinase [Paenibacillus piri]TDF95767.1 sensor histidine kinase [Paenibacillus piri]
MLSKRNKDKRMPPISFQNKLLLSYGLITLIPVLSALFIFGLNSYNDTKRYYEEFMNQLSGRADTITNEFIANTARNSYFYLTDNNLKNILEKRYVQDKIELLEDARSMQKAMDQVVLMNGQITGVTIMGTNGSQYSSYAAYSTDAKMIRNRIAVDDMYRGTTMVYVEEGPSGHNKRVSLVRYLSDINRDDTNKEGFVKVDLNYRAIEKNFGGVAETNRELGTVVIADGKLLYTTWGSLLQDEEIGRILSRLHDEKNQMNSLMRITIGSKSYLFTARINKLTNWIIVQIIPSEVITAAFHKNIQIYVLICALALGIALLLAVVFSKHFFKPIHKLRTKMKLADAGHLDLVIDEEHRRDEIGQLVHSYNAMLMRMKRSREVEMRSQQLQKRAELHMLQAQINPHFLYNTLNVIHSIAELHRVQQISIMTKALSNLYRYNVKSKDIVTVRSELEQIGNYLKIQQIRFLDKHRVVYDIDEELYDCQILKFLLQPIVENSFQHGLEPKGDHGTLLIGMRRQGNILRIRVEDDGVGIDEAKLEALKTSLVQTAEKDESDSKHHLGLRNVAARIRNFYGPHYGLKVTSKPNEGTCVEMFISSKKGDERNDRTFG